MTTRTELTVATPSAPIPDYLTQVYDWAYVTPRAVQMFERQWLVNLILWGNFARLRDDALEVFGDDLTGKTLQVACVYGDLTGKLLARHSSAGHLDVLDVLPVQLANLKHKLGIDAERVGIHQENSADMSYPNACYDRSLLFFLLHEQPEEVRRKTLAEALRVTKPGGTLVIVDYHRPGSWHPLRLLMRAILSTLEPFALDLWTHEISDWLPSGVTVQRISKRTLFGGLYQLIEITR